MRMKKRKECRCSRGPTAFAVGLSACLLVAGGLGLAAAPTLAATPLGDVECPSSLGSCVANDVVTTLLSAQPLNGDICDGSPGDTIDLEFTVEFMTTASERYDLAVFIAEDGGTIIGDSTAIDCAGAAAQVGDGNPGSYPDADADLFQDLDPSGHSDSPSTADTCGDLSTAQGPVQWTLTATVDCSIVSGSLIVESCRVWEQNANHKLSCTNLAEAGTGSKCDCTPLDFGPVLDPCAITVCDDGNECTADSCVSGGPGTEAQCVYEPLPSGSSCTDDGSFCTGEETCNDLGECVSAGDPCPGNDGLFCNGIEYCDEEADACLSTGDPCSGAECNTCQEDTDSCFDPIGTLCGDPTDDQCNNPDTCDGAGTCIDNYEPSTTTCDDGLFCTSTSGVPGDADNCNGLGNDGAACVGDPVECDDGLYCSGTESCDDTLDQCVSSGDPCSGDECNTCQEDTDSCFDPVGTACGDPTDDQCNNPDTCDGAGACIDNFEPAATTCDDGLYCTSTSGVPGDADNCNGLGNDGAACVGGPVECDDGLYCSGTESCDDTLDQCVSSGDPCSGAECNTCQEDTDSCFDPAGTACGDQTDDQCNNPDTCNGAGTCIDNFEPAATTCDDGFYCTSTSGLPGDADNCNGLGNDGAACVGGPVDCNDGEYCTGTETCDDDLDQCVSSGDPCPGTECNTCQEDTDSCFDPEGTACGSDFDDQCDNPDTCDGEGACLDNYEPPTTECDDGFACTSTSGVPNETDNCDGEGLCVGQTVTCPDDGNECTFEACTEPDGCASTPEEPGTPCDDGLLCTSYDGTPASGDACDGDSNCIGAPVDCNDDRLCTDEYCDELDPNATPSGCVFTYDQTNDDLCPIEPPLDPPCEDGDCDPEVCRTKGFWGTHAPLMGLLLVDYGYEGFEVCGQAVTSIEPSFSGSAVEGLCTSPRGDVSISAVSQLLAASFNCILTSGSPFCMDTTAADIWAQLNSACVAGDEAMMREYHEQLDCWNNGGEFDEVLGCVLGLCDGIPGEFCGEVSCDPDQECIPFADSCHEQPLEILWLDPPLSLEPASQWVDGERRCREARRSRDDYFRARCPGHPSCSLL